MRAREAGFTLIEIMVAILLMAMMMTSLYMMLNGVISSKDKVSVEDRALLQVHTFFQRFDTDFSQLYSPLFYSVDYKEIRDHFLSREDRFENSDHFPVISDRGYPAPAILSKEKNEIVFMSSSNRRKMEGEKQSYYVWVRYSVRETPDDIMQELSGEEADKANERQGPYEIIRQSMSTNPYWENLDWEKVQAQVILRGVQEVQFAYWDQESERFQEKPKVSQKMPVIPVVGINLKWKANGEEMQWTKSFRALWPFFDAYAENKRLQQERNRKIIENDGSEFPATPTTNGPNNTNNRVNNNTENPAPNAGDEQ